MDQPYNNLALVAGFDASEFSSFKFVWKQSTALWYGMEVNSIEVAFIL